MSEKVSDKIARRASVILTKATKRTRSDFNWDSISTIISNISAFLSFIISIITAVEEAAKNSDFGDVEIRSADKMDAAVEIVDDQVDLGFWDFFDQKILGVIISLVVAVMNKFFGKNWLENTIK